VPRGPSSSPVSETLFAVVDLIRHGSHPQLLGGSGLGIECPQESRPALEETEHVHGNAHSPRMMEVASRVARDVLAPTRGYTMSTPEQPKYESPLKKKVVAVLAKQGPHLSPTLRRKVEEAIEGLDHTNPREAVELLPPTVLDFYVRSDERGTVLVPLVVKAHEAGCYIESIVLSHGIIQFALRGLYVLAWQRTVMPLALSESDLAPYYKQRSKRGDVVSLVKTLEESGLILADHAEHLRRVNADRNSAAHGVIFGEVDIAALAEPSKAAQRAALGALQMLRAWFDNPRPLKSPSVE
jgi:hypothetical protein